MTRHALAVLAVAEALAGCGGGGTTSSTTGAVPERRSNATSYTEAKLASVLHVRPGDQLPDRVVAGSVDLATGCTVSVFMTTAGQVSVYADAGDPVATNPSRTAGVKYGANGPATESECYRIFTSRLKVLR